MPVQRPQYLGFADDLWPCQKYKADVLLIGAPSERVIAPSPQGATGVGDDESSGKSLAGAAKAERDDDDDADTANDARSREELDGSFMEMSQVANRA